MKPIIFANYYYFAIFFRKQFENFLSLRTDDTKCTYVTKTTFCNENLQFALRKKNLKIPSQIIELAKASATCHKHFWGFLRPLTIVSSHCKWHRTILLSPETACTSYLTNFEQHTAYDFYNLRRWRNFKKISKFSGAYCTISLPEITICK